MDKPAQFHDELDLLSSLCWSENAVPGYPDGQSYATQIPCQEVCSYLYSLSPFEPIDAWPLLLYHDSIPTHSLKKNSCILRSPLNSGWKLVTSFFPCFMATTLIASISAGPSGESVISGIWGTRSAGRTQRFSVGWFVEDDGDGVVVGSPEVLVRDDATREWMAGARMKMAGKGISGLRRPWKGILASKLSF
jgi:hypothetical protein